VKPETADLLFARRLVAAGQARAVREAADLPRDQLARDIEASSAAVRAWECGIRRPTGALGARYGALLRELLADQ
jgi:DNA-binding transcriptional regulator YiaG